MEEFSIDFSSAEVIECTEYLLMNNRIPSNHPMPPAPRSGRPFCSGGGTRVRIPSLPPSVIRIIYCCAGAAPADRAEVTTGRMKLVDSSSNPEC
ncbi:hypothetical protein BJX96DRAFT_157992 [Aspergillus floccosus]